MTYFDFKFFHIALALGYVYLLVAACFNPRVKFFKLALGFCSMILFLSGFSLLGKLSIPHSGPFPIWVWVKMGIWIIIATAPPIIIRRFPNKAKFACPIFFILIIIAAYMGIYKIA